MACSMPTPMPSRQELNTLGAQMHSSWKSKGGGGPWFFLANSFEGGTGGCEKIRGGRVLLHFYVEVFQKSL